MSFENQAKFNNKVPSDQVEYAVGERFDEAGLPDAYIGGKQGGHERDGRGLPAQFALTATLEKSDIIKAQVKEAEKMENYDSTKHLDFGENNYE